MPIIKVRYSGNWPEIASQVKDAADWCCSECGKPCRKPGVEWLKFSFWLMITHPEWFPLTSEGEVQKSQRFNLTKDLGYKPRSSRTAFLDSGYIASKSSKVLHLQKRQNNLDSIDFVAEV